jgi:hypothetical protein
MAGLRDSGCCRRNGSVALTKDVRDAACHKRFDEVLLLNDPIGSFCL